VYDWAMNMNEIHTFPYLSVKFSYYEMQTMRLEKPWDIDKSLEILAERRSCHAGRQRLVWESTALRL